MNRNMFRMVVKPFKIDEQKLIRELIKRIDRFRELQDLEPINGPELGWQGMERIPTRRRSAEVIIVKTREKAEQVSEAWNKEND